MRIIVTGPGGLDDVELVGRALAPWISTGEPLTLVHGATGAFRAVIDQVAAQHGLDVEVHAVYGRRTRRRSKAINQALVDRGAAVCVAFPLPLAGDVWDCVRRAERAGITTILHRPDGDDDAWP